MQPDRSDMSWYAFVPDPLHAVSDSHPFGHFHLFDAIIAIQIAASTLGG
jgi:hypothetical protein